MYSQKQSQSVDSVTTMYRTIPHVEAVEKKKKNASYISDSQMFWAIGRSLCSFWDVRQTYQIVQRYAE